MHYVCFFPTISCYVCASFRQARVYHKYIKRYIGNYDLHAKQNNSYLENMRLPDNTAKRMLIKRVKVTEIIHAQYLLTDFLSVWLELASLTVSKQFWSVGLIH